MGRGRRVLIAAIVLPALAGVVAAYRLGTAGVEYARHGEDPLLSRLLGPGGTGDAPPEALAAAANAAPADFRYPYWTGRRVVLDRAAGPADLLAAFESLRTAAELARSVAEVRYYLSVAAARLGRIEVADAQARAALELAPLHGDLARRLAGWFFERYRRTGESAHLAAALRAGGLGAEEARAFLATPLMTFEEAERILDLAGLELGEKVDLLISANRWDWALRIVPEDDRVRRARIRLGLGRYLLELGSAAAAGRELEAAAEVLGDELGAWRELGLARARSGRPEAAREAWLRAVRSGEPPARVDAAMAEGGLDAAGRAAVFEALAADPEAGAGVALALGRSLFEAGRMPDAERALRRAIGGGGEEEAEANHLLARIFLGAGNRAMAKSYADRAVALRPDRKDYRKLADSLAETER